MQGRTRIDGARRLVSLAPGCFRHRNRWHRVLHSRQCECLSDARSLTGGACPIAHLKVRRGGRWPFYRGVAKRDRWAGRRFGAVVICGVKSGWLALPWDRAERFEGNFVRATLPAEDLTRRTEPGVRPTSTSGRATREESRSVRGYHAASQNSPGRPRLLRAGCRSDQGMTIIPPPVSL